MHLPHLPLLMILPYCRKKKDKNSGIADIFAKKGKKKQLEVAATKKKVKSARQSQDKEAKDRKMAKMWLKGLVDLRYVNNNQPLPLPLIPTLESSPLPALL